MKPTRLFDFADYQLKYHSQEECFLYKEDQQWKKISTKEYLKRANKVSASLLELGISIPIVLLPGMVATLVEIELVFLAISSAKEIILETFIPEAGSNSYNVTTGP